MRIGEWVSIPSGPFAGKSGEIVEILQKTVKIMVGSAPVVVPREMLDAIEKAEAEAEVPTKRHPAKMREEDVVEKKRDKDRGKLHEESEHTPETPKIEKKEETIVTTVPANPPAQPARVEPAYCPLCGNIRRKATDIVCGNCYRTYTNDAAMALAHGQSGQYVFDWVAGKAPAILTALEGQFTLAKAEVERLQRQVGDETLAALKGNAGGKVVPKEVWDSAFRIKKQELWRANGGNVKFAIMKGLESRVVLLKSILEKAAEPKPATPAAETVAPGETVVAPVDTATTPGTPG